MLTVSQADGTITITDTGQAAGFLLEAQNTGNDALLGACESAIVAIIQSVTTEQQQPNNSGSITTLIHWTQ